MARACKEAMSGEGMMIDIQVLRYALAAADLGSFSGAASRFGVKQATLSRHIHHLEDRLGLSLFSRSSRGVALTHPGARILDQARRIVEDLEALDRDGRALAQGTAGTLRIGFQGALHSGELFAVLRAFELRWPDVALEAHEGGRSALTHALARGHLDVLVLPGRLQLRDVTSLQGWLEPVQALLDSSSAREPLYWSDLRGQAFVVSAADPGPCLADLIVSRLSGPGQRPEVLVQNVSRDNLVAFAGTGRTVIFTGPAPATASASIVVRPVHDAFGPSSLAQRIHWDPRNDNAALARFIELLACRYGRPILGD